MVNRDKEAPIVFGLLGALLVAGYGLGAAGNKVDPLEVERVLCENPAVAEAAVVGVPGPHALEIVKAAVVRRSDVTERELMEFCRDRLAAYKVPRLFQFVERLPRSPTGKLLRKELLD